MDTTPVTATAPQWAWDAVLDVVRAAIVSRTVGAEHLDDQTIERLKAAETALDFQ